MNSLKDHVRKAHPTINHFLTYADNYAVGYFKKQGFTKQISLPRERWVGYIKDYEGGTIMQCTMLPKVRYMEVHQMLADQKAVSLPAHGDVSGTQAQAVLAKIRTISRSHVVRPGLQIFKDRKPGQEIKLTKADVPGLGGSWVILRRPQLTDSRKWLEPRDRRHVSAHQSSRTALTIACDNPAATQIMFYSSMCSMISKTSPRLGPSSSPWTRKRSRTTTKSSPSRWVCRSLDLLVWG